MCRYACRIYCVAIFVLLQIVVHLLVVVNVYEAAHCRWMPKSSDLVTTFSYMLFLYKIECLKLNFPVYVLDPTKAPPAAKVLTDEPPEIIIPPFSTYGTEEYTGSIPTVLSSISTENTSGKDRLAGVFSSSRPVIYFTLLQPETNEYLEVEVQEEDVTEETSTIPESSSGKGKSKTTAELLDIDPGLAPVTTINGVSEEMEKEEEEEVTEEAEKEEDMTEGISRKAIGPLDINIEVQETAGTAEEVTEETTSVRSKLSRLPTKKKSPKPAISKFSKFPTFSKFTKKPRPKTFTKKHTSPRTKPTTIGPEVVLGMIEPTEDYPEISTATTPPKRRHSSRPSPLVLPTEPEIPEMNEPTEDYPEITETTPIKKLRVRPSRPPSLTLPTHESTEPYPEINEIKPMKKRRTTRPTPLILPTHGAKVGPVMFPTGDYPEISETTSTKKRRSSRPPPLILPPNEDYPEITETTIKKRLRPSRPPPLILPPVEPTEDYPEITETIPKKHRIRPSRPPPLTLPSPEDYIEITETTPKKHRFRPSRPAPLTLPSPEDYPEIAETTPPKRQRLRSSLPPPLTLPSPEDYPEITETTPIKKLRLRSSRPPPLTIPSPEDYPEITETIPIKKLRLRPSLHPPLTLPSPDSTEDYPEILTEITPTKKRSPSPLVPTTHDQEIVLGMIEPTEDHPEISTEMTQTRKKRPIPWFLPRRKKAQRPRVTYLKQRTLFPRTLFPGIRIRRKRLATTNELLKILYTSYMAFSAKRNKTTTSSYRFKKHEKKKEAREHRRKKSTLKEIDIFSTEKPKRSFVFPQKSLPKAFHQLRSRSFPNDYIDTSTDPSMSTSSGLASPDSGVDDSSDNVTARWEADGKDASLTPKYEAKKKNPPRKGSPDVYREPTGTFASEKFYSKAKISTEPVRLKTEAYFERIETPGRTPLQHKIPLKTYEVDVPNLPIDIMREEMLEEEREFTTQSPPYRHKTKTRAYYGRPVKTPAANYQPRMKLRPYNPNNEPIDILHEEILDDEEDSNTPRPYQHFYVPPIHLSTEEDFGPETNLEPDDFRPKYNHPLLPENPLKIGPIRVLGDLEDDEVDDDREENKPNWELIRLHPRHTSPNPWKNDPRNRRKLNGKRYKRQVNIFVRDVEKRWLETLPNEFRHLPTAPLLQYNGSGFAFGPDGPSLEDRKIPVDVKASVNYDIIEWPRRAKSLVQVYRFAVAYIFLDSLWALATILLMIAACVRIHGPKAYFLFMPFILVTLAIIILDLVAAIYFTVKILNTQTWIGFLHTMGCTNLTSISDTNRYAYPNYDYEYRVPALYATLFCIRGVLIWLLNIICLLIIWHIFRVVVHRRHVTKKTYYTLPAANTGFNRCQ